MAKGNFVRPASRAGIKDPRSSTFVARLDDIERQSHRPKPISAETSMLRAEDLEIMGELPAQEPLGSAAPAPMTVASRMIAVFTPKGGTGGTTVAVNMGGALAHLGKSVVVVDMDLQLGAVPVALNIRPERSIAEIMRSAESSGSGPLQTGLDRHSSGMCVLAQGERIEELPEITAERLPRLFDALGQSFPYVIVDGLRDFSDHAVATMDLAHLVMMVVTQDVPAVRAAARCLRIFRRLGYGPDRIRLIVNRYHKRAPVTLEAIQNALGQPVEAVIHNDFPLIEQSLNLGALVSEVKPAARTARDLEAITWHYAGVKDPPVSGGFFSRLFRSK